MEQLADWPTQYLRLGATILAAEHQPTRARRMIDDILADSLKFSIVKDNVEKLLGAVKVIVMYIYALITAALTPQALFSP